MLHASLLLLLGFACQTAPKFEGELKSQDESPPPLLVFEGRCNLPNKAIVEIYLYHGNTEFGAELLRGRCLVQNGSFLHEFPLFTRKNFPGRYTVRLLFDPELQNLATPGFMAGRADLTFSFGKEEDLVRETRAFRQQLETELRVLAALGDEVAAKLKELQGKSDPALWEPLINGWRDRMNEVEGRTDPRKVPEYVILRLRHIADSGVEHVGAILMAAARCGARGQNEACVEGLTRLRQTVESYAAQISAPKLYEKYQIAQLIQEARTLLRETAAKSGQPTLAARRRFVEMTQLLDRSFPEDAHAIVLEMGARGAEFFPAVADSKPEAPEILAALEQILDRLVAVMNTK